MKRIISIIMLISMLMLSACGDDTPSADTEKPVDSLIETEVTDTMKIEGPLEIIKNKASDYVMVCDFKDSVAKGFADEFSSLLFTKYGVTIKPKKAMLGVNDKELIIGDTDREATVAIKAQLAESDFAVCAYGDDLVLYATDVQQYSKMLAALKEVILPEGDTFTFYETDNFISSLRSDVVVQESEVELFKDGKSDYSIVYGANDADSKLYAQYLRYYVKQEFGITLPMVEDTTAVEKAIVVKGASDGDLKVVEKKLYPIDDFTVSVVDSKVILTATDNQKMILGMMKLVDMCQKGTDGKSVKLREADNFIYSEANRVFNYDAKEFCERYQAIYETYSTYHEAKLNSSWLTNRERNDQKLIEALVKRMGRAAVIMNGSSSVIYDGFIRKLDTTDYTRTAIVSGTTVKIPRQFAESYFNAKLTTDENGYVDVSAYVKNSVEYTLYISDDKTLAIITPKNVKSFADANASDGNYKNSVYIERMEEFFHSEYIPEPGVNTEQSRVEIENVQYPEYAPDYLTQEYQTTYSPSILVVNENGKSVYYVSYEMSTVVNFEELSVYTVVKKSVDGGKTWTTVVKEIPDLRWASIFENKGVIYVMGADLYKEIGVIVKIGENGSYQKAELAKGATAPGAVVHANGRIYKEYHSVVFSASEDADLMKTSSWTVSNGALGGEGNIVLGKGGQLYRVAHGEAGEAYVTKVSVDGTTQTPAFGSDGKVNMPTSKTKFSCIYDDVSGKYMVLTSICNYSAFDRQRNVLALVVSDDLYNWEIAEYILVERELINPLYSILKHAWQYVDFKIDGDDIVMVVREASGETNTYHDGNYTTFYRMENFRDLLDNARGYYGPQ